MVMVFCRTMSGAPPQLPPAALAGHQAAAHIDRVAVRLINLPAGIRDGNAAGVRLTGTVAGTRPDGTIDIQTDKGVVTIALRDRGSLPTGTRIDIEIPAGNNPQKASIAADKSPAPAPQRNESSASERPPNQLQIKQNLSTRALESVITNTARAAPPTQLQAVAEAPLEAGQTIRLLPLPPTANAPLALPADTPDIITALTNLLQTAQSDAATAAIGNSARATLANILAQVLQNVPLNALPPALLKNMEATLQSIATQDLASGEGDGLLSGIPKTPQNIGYTNTYSTPLNLGKPLLGQVMGFVGIQTAASQANINNLSAALGPFPAQTPTTLGGSTAPTPATATYIGQYQGNIGPQGQPVITLNIPVQTISPLAPHTTPLPSTAALLTTALTAPVAQPISPSVPMSFSLPVTPTNIPVGASVIVTLSNEEATTSLQPPLVTTIKSWFQGGITTQTWDTLDGVLSLLAQNNPSQAAGFARLIPSPMTPQNMGPLSLFFLSMVRSGDVENWMGREAMATLRQTSRGNDLLRLLSGESRLLRQTEATPLPQDWRAMTLPFHFGHHIQKLPVYYKHTDDDAASKDKERKARRLRFLFDLQMTRMGAVQVDGFLQSQAEKQENQRLDIILRTKQQLSTSMQSQMKRIYAGATEKSRLTGDLSFQFRPEQWVTLDLGPAAFDDAALV